MQGYGRTELSVRRPCEMGSVGMQGWNEWGAVVWNSVEELRCFVFGYG